MSDNTTATATASDPTPVTEPSPSDFFTLSPFGDVKITEGNRVAIPADLAKWFAASVKMLNGKPNTTVIGPIVRPDRKASDLLRKQLRQWAGDNDKAVSFKGLVKTEDANGNPVNTDAEIKTDEFNVPFNDDTHVTFRLSAHKVTETPAPVTVTVTAGAASMSGG